jgi:Flp pilus assembly protein TadD
MATENAASPVDWRKAIPLLVLVGMCAYANSFTKAFVLDDVYWISDRAANSSLGWYLEHMCTRPVIGVTLWLNQRLGGLNPTGYHAFNLAIHIGAALCLFGIVRRTLLLGRWNGRFLQSAPWLALAVALIWMVHPLQTASVTYVIQRCESLMGFFYLLTLYCVLRSADTPSRRLGWSVAAVAACAVGMGCKEVMVTAPVVVLLYDRQFLAGSFRQALRQRWGLYAGLAATWPVLAAGQFLAPRQTVESAGFGFKGITPLHYAMTQPGVILHYLKLSFWPFSLCLFDQDWPITRTLTAFLPPALVVAALLAGTVWGLLRGSWLGFLGAWFFLILAPTSSIMPIAAPVFEHRMYLSLAAVVVLVVLGGHAVLEQLARRGGGHKRPATVLGTGLVVVLVAGLSLLTLRRNEDYRSEVTMWTDVVHKRPGSHWGHAILANAYLNESDIDLAMQHAREALRLQPGDLGSRIYLGLCLWQEGKVKEAIAEYRRALELEPAGKGVYRGVVDLDLGLALLHHGEVEEAVQKFQEAVRLEPEREQYHRHLALALSRLGRTAEADAEYRESQRLDPGWPRQVNEQARTAALADEGERPPGALKDTILLAEEVNQATRYQNADMLDTLAIAYAEAGRFEEAAATARKALDRLADSDPEKANRFRLRLRLYERRQPFREDTVRAAEAARGRS